MINKQIIKKNQLAILGLWVWLILLAPTGWAQTEPEPTPAATFGCSAPVTVVSDPDGVSQDLIATFSHQGDLGEEITVTVQDAWPAAGGNLDLQTGDDGSASDWFRPDVTGFTEPVSPDNATIDNQVNLNLTVPSDAPSGTYAVNLDLNNLGLTQGSCLVVVYVTSTTSSPGSVISVELGDQTLIDLTDNTVTINLVANSDFVVIANLALRSGDLVLEGEDLVETPAATPGTRQHSGLVAGESIVYEGSLSDLWADQLDFTVEFDLEGLSERQVLTVLASQIIEPEPEPEPEPEANPEPETPAAPTAPEDNNQATPSSSTDSDPVATEDSGSNLVLYGGLLLALMILAILGLILVRRRRRPTSPDSPFTPYLGSTPPASGLPPSPLYPPTSPLPTSPAPTVSPPPVNPGSGNSPASASPAPTGSPPGPPPASGGPAPPTIP